GGTWEEYGSIDDWNDLVNFVTSNDMSDPANYEYVTSVYNQTSLIDYMILNSYTVNADWLNWNTSWWRGRHPDGDAKRWRYSLWDMDNTFGHGANYTGLPDVNPGADPCNPENLGDTGGQGHIPIFNALMQNEDFQIEYYNRWASLSNQYFSCEYMNGLLDEMTGRIAPEMQRQVDRWGGTYGGWENAIQEMRDFIDERCATTTVEGLEDCYDIVPVVLTVIIEGVGEVEISAADIGPNNSPWTGNFWIDVPVSMEAEFEDGQVFLFWEVQAGNITIDDPTNPELTVTLTEDATIIAHFGVPEPVDVMFDVQPAGAGDLLVNGASMAPFPNTVTMDWGLHDLQATTNDPWMVFSHWDVLNGTVNPDENDPIGTIFLSQTDTIVAVFNEIPHFDLSVDVIPAGAGSVVMNGASLPTLPWSDTIEGELDYTFVTSPNDPPSSYRLVTHHRHPKMWEAYRITTRIWRPVRVGASNRRQTETE
ncbi:MAG: CotH kinase family protein, partial [Bacteroidota bacterium]